MLQKIAGDIILYWGWKRNGLAFLAGLILNFSLPPFDFFAVGFVSFPVLLWLLEGAEPSPSARGFLRTYPAAVVGWFFGFGYFLGGLWWLGNALVNAGSEFLWAVPLAILGLPAGLAFFFSLAGVIVRMVPGHGIGAAASLALAIGLTEWFRGFVFTGFPWNSIGMTIMPSPVLMQSASVFGMVGMNALAVFVYALPGCFVLSRYRWFGPFLAALLFGAHAAFGFVTLGNAPVVLPPADAKTVRIVQPSIAQTDKWDEEERNRIFSTYLKMTAQLPEEGKPVPSLVIWPETAVPFIFTDRPDALGAIGEALSDGQVLLAGAVRQEGVRENGDELRFYNSVVAINSNGEIIDASDKVHLVPFGEYLPMEDPLRSLGVSQVVAMPGGFTAGSRLKLFSLPDLPAILPLICYEIIFPGALELAKERPDLVVNVTNDAWYGHTPGPYQHFRLAQIRATESGIPVIRSANNGVSGFIDARGRVSKALDLDVVGNLDMPMDKNSSKTYYSTDGTRTIFATYCLLLALIGLTNLLQRFKMTRSV
ncbi:MAG: apolipoprotein N-acyltransferase [Rhizobiaceae bacterium]